MNPDVRERRFQRVREALAKSRADALLVPASADFTWLTGAVARSTERLVAFALPRSGDPFAVVPRLESGPIAEECPWLSLEIWDEQEDPVERLARRIDLAKRPVLALGEGWRTTVLLRLAAATTCSAAAEVLAPLRAIKDADEGAALVEAGTHADQIVMEAARQARPGMTENELARWILNRFEAAGDTAPWAIVAAGPNSASPHHSSSDRKIAAGEVLLIDCGASTRGYSSDITRTFFLGEPPEDVRKVHGVVDEARRAAIAAVRAGAIPEQVDRAARAVIERAGYGEFFTHRTGHGVGLEVHERPFIVAGNREPLAAGNAHSVEPGIYLPGRFGVRIEDLVLVTPDGARVLNHAPHGLSPAGDRTPEPVPGAPGA